MKILLPLLLLFVSSLGYSQELESDLFAALNYSSLNLFKDSEKSRMTVTTYRQSNDEGNVIETISTYRKGKINVEKMNFNIKYTEHFAVEDRKKSLGNYEFKDGRLSNYERTDFDHTNRRLYTLYTNLRYDNEIVSRENLRNKEYISSGSVDFDTIVVRDSVIYEVSEVSKGYRQDNLSEPGSYTIYEISNDKLIQKTSYFEGFIEKVTYKYDARGHLIEIVNVLSNDEGGSATSRTELHYTNEDLLDETKFYDETGELLERKTFEYK